MTSACLSLMTPILSKERIPKKAAKHHQLKGGGIEDHASETKFSHFPAKDNTPPRSISSYFWESLLPPMMGAIDITSNADNRNSSNERAVLLGSSCTHSAGDRRT